MRLSPPSIMLSLLLAVACDVVEDSAARADLALDCTFHDGVDHEATIDVPMCTISGPADCTESPWTQTYGKWAVDVVLEDDENSGRNVTISVHPAAGAGGVSVLYQMDREHLPSNDFHGGHGFTGLHYVRDPGGGTTFQFFCRARAL